MKNQLAAALFIVLSPIVFVSCVSSLLAEKAPTFSKEVGFTAPPLPFYFLNKSVFPSWKNRSTGNVLSILSDCQPGNPTSLNDLQRLIEDSVENSVRVKENLSTYQNHPALNRTIRAELDGSPLEIRSMAFKKANCGYVVSLSGKSEQLNLDQNQFDLFVKSLTFK